jgi:hypothetical protein
MTGRAGSRDGDTILDGDTPLPRSGVVDGARFVGAGPAGRAKVYGPRAGTRHDTTPGPAHDSFDPGDP